MALGFIILYLAINTGEYEFKSLIIAFVCGLVPLVPIEIV